MNIVERITHEDSLSLSRHSSNPFDDPNDSAKRILGLGSSELSDCSSSNFGEYGDPTLEHILETGFEHEEENALDQVMDEPGDIEMNTYPDNMDADYDDSSIDTNTDEDFDEENSIYFRSPEERQEITEEIDDLLRAVPRLRDDYYLLDRLGTGTFSSVYKAIDLMRDAWDNTPWQGVQGEDMDGQASNPGPHRKSFVAIKRIYATSMPDRIRNELSILEDLRGCRHVSQLITAFREEDQVVAIMPYHRSADFREYYLTLSMNEVKNYMRSLFRGLRDIHARGIIHRDIKPANFLFDPKTSTGTIVDLGLACRINYDEGTLCNHTAPSDEYPHGRIKTLDQLPIDRLREAKNSARARSKWTADRVGYPENDTRPQSKANRAGTRGFRAPEVLLKCTSQSGAVDIWSAGTILLFFLTGKFPIFHCPNDTEALVELSVLLGRKAIEKAGLLHKQEGKDLRDFIRNLNPGLFVHEGPDGDTSQAKQHEIDVEQAIDLLKATFQPESTKRITARETLYHPFLKEPDRPEDDEFFPHPWGQGVCGEYHDRDFVTGDLQLYLDGDMYKVNAGQYTPIGGKPCAFHKNLFLEHSL
ncbi:hypothetical protein Clacol_001270 [Clathrus columnatus]|uniref:non-specific serine/threonine protein kinase n=1 Tax=Clathrus columnatus TaxID=1419009 RepID=A0AAV5A3D4_9AGAM|nr:hypothetical protein Clacol_001270 [Clathrus columnatus]